MSSRPGTWARFRDRIRFGLATQEVLDRLSRVGILIYPYFVVEEPIVDRPEFADLYPHLQVKRLEPGEAHLIASVPERPRDEAAVRDMLEQATCIAVLEEGELLAYSFFTSALIPGGLSEVATSRLPDDWAYLFDMYVRPKARGGALAAWMRHRVHQALAEAGVSHGCSLSLAFNRSTRRFKSKLGAVERELRLRLRVKPLPGIDVRIRRHAWAVPTPFVSVVHTSGDRDR